MFVFSQLTSPLTPLPRHPPPWAAANRGAERPPLAGMAALHEAVLTGNLDCVKLLVKYGADIHQRDENGWTPLHMACSDGYADIAR